MNSNSVNRLKVLLENIPTLLLEISEDLFSIKINSSKWSKKEILGHLIDSAANNHQRFIRGQFENIPTIKYDQNKWNELNHYQQLESKHIIQLWTIYNQHLLEILKRIPEENLCMELNVGNEINVTLQFLMDDYLLHLEHHLKQIVDYKF
ncbi:MAG: DinB family protein [Bacteroidetes bacterium]|nr:DinB family protein [Bacteroidota bacterium]